VAVAVAGRDPAGAVLLARLPAAAARDDREEQRKGLGEKGAAALGLAVAGGAPAGGRTCGLAATTGGQRAGTGIEENAARVTGIPSVRF
jgi:hypothetical protein